MRAYMNSPAGLLCIETEDDAVVRIDFVKDKKDEERACAPLLAQVKRQLEEYFSGVRQEFSLPVHLRGTPFQMQVWHVMAQIPYGETWSYGDIAKRLGKPGAARAVGMACNKNPVSIVYPCHRVVGAKGQLVGYASGVEKKAYLLELEQKNRINAELYSNCICVRKGVDFC